jgi:ubiquinone/menaquinone biosynthesis C-methylase UbiE
MKKISFSAERLETHRCNFTTIEHLHRYAIAKELCTGKQVLDIACGEGYGSNLLAQIAAKVIGVDIDEATVERAKMVYKKPNLNFIIGTCSSIALENNSIDVVVSFETIEHHDQHEEMLSEIKRVLKPDGILIISTPDKKHYSDDLKYSNPYHVKELYLDEFETLIKRHFSYYQIYYQRYISGSLIVSANNFDGYEEFCGNYELIEKKTELNGIYNICVAGSQEINNLNTSIFTGEAAVEQAAQQLVNRVQQSNSYRLGHFLLSPFRFFQKWIR